MGRNIAVVSGKGGTGKTTFSLNFAVTLSRLGKKTVVVDMNTGLRSLDLAAGVENVAIFDIYDVMNEVSSVSSIVVHPGYDTELGIIAACQDIACEPEICRGLHYIIDVLRDELGYDYVVIDCPPGIGYCFDACVEAVDDVIIAVNPDHQSLRDAEAVEDRIIGKYAVKRYYIVNNVSYDMVNKGLELRIELIDERMKCDMLGIIPADQNIRMSVNIGIPVVLKRDTYIANNFDRIAERYLGQIIKI